MTAVAAGAEQAGTGRTGAAAAVPGQLTIRPMTAADVAEAAALEAASFSMPWSESSFADAIGREDALFLVARAEALLGYAGVSVALDEGEITNVAVAEGARRRGVARRLLETLAERLMERGVRRIFLEVRVSNTPAIRLYESLGFEIAGTRRRFYERPVEDAYVMVCEPAVPYGAKASLSLQ